MDKIEFDYWLNMSNDEREKNVPQKNEVTNHTNNGNWTPTDDYTQAREVVNRLRSSGTCISDDYNDYLKVNFAFAHAFGESGRSLAEEVCAMSSKFDETDFNKKYDNCLRTGNGSITIATFYQMAKNAGVDIRTSRPEQNDCANCADEHTYVEKEEKDKSLIIINNNFMTNSEKPCAIAQTAQNSTDGVVFNTTFSDKTNPEDWCDFFQPVIQNMDTPESRDKMLLGSLGVISGLVPDNIYSEYDQREIFAPLCIIFFGVSGSGKGDLPHIMEIINPLKNEIENTYHAELAEYKNQHAIWEAKKGKDERMERGLEPQEPEFRSPLIPGESSSTAALMLLKRNGGWGVIFETEGDVIGNSFKTDYGDYSVIVRKAAHHETVSISRVRDKLFISIPKPRLAVIITLTPGQLPNLFPTFEDGLGARFLYYGLNRKLEWRDPFKVSPKPLREVFSEMGEKYLELHHEIQKLGNRRIQIILSGEQKQKFNEYFTGLLMEQFSMLGEGIESFVFRLALSGIRLIIVLSLLRRYSDWDRNLPLFGEYEQAMVCSDKDFHIAMTIVDTLVNHTAKIFTSLNKVETKNIFNHPVDLSSQERRLYDALPDDFTSTDVKETAISLGINPETARRYNGTFVKQNIAMRITSGHYRKTNLKK